MTLTQKKAEDAFRLGFFRKMAELGMPPEVQAEFYKVAAMIAEYDAQPGEKTAAEKDAWVGALIGSAARLGPWLARLGPKALSLLKAGGGAAKAGLTAAGRGAGAAMGSAGRGLASAAGKTGIKSLGHAGRGLQQGGLAMQMAPGRSLLGATKALPGAAWKGTKAVGNFAMSPQFMAGSMLPGMFSGGAKPGGQGMQAALGAGMGQPAAFSGPGMQAAMR